MEVVLEDNGFKEFVHQEIPNSVALYAQNLVEWKKCVVKVSQIILEGDRHHIVSSLHYKENFNTMWKGLKNLYQNNSGQRKLVLKDKL